MKLLGKNRRGAANPQSHRTPRRRRPKHASRKPIREDTKRQEISRILQYSVFCVNIIFWVAGFASIAIGIYAYVDQFRPVLEVLDFFLNPAILLILGGCIIFAISFLGCIGALRENVCMLKFFGLTLFLAYIALVITAFVVFLLFYSDTETKLSIYSIMVKAVERYHENENIGEVINTMQSELKCCGATNQGYKDWNKNPLYNCSSHNDKAPERCGVPHSCCVPREKIPMTRDCGFGAQKKSTPELEGLVYTDGCLPKLRASFEHHAVTIGATIGAVIIPVCLSIILSNVLWKQIERQRWRLDRQARREERWRRRLKRKFHHHSTNNGGVSNSPSGGDSRPKNGGGGGREILSITNEHLGLELSEQRPSTSQQQACTSSVSMPVLESTSDATTQPTTSAGLTEETRLSDERVKKRRKQADDDSRKNRTSAQLNPSALAPSPDSETPPELPPRNHPRRNRRKEPENATTSSAIPLDSVQCLVEGTSNNRLSGGNQAKRSSVAPPPGSEIRLPPPPTGAGDDKKKRRHRAPPPIAQEVTKRERGALKHSHSDGELKPPTRPEVRAAAHPPPSQSSRYESQRSVDNEGVSPPSRAQGNPNVIQSTAISTIETEELPREQGREKRRKKRHDPVS